MSLINHCSVPGCMIHVPSESIMCSDHWSQVPEDLKEDVRQAEVKFHAGQMDEETLRGYWVTATFAVCVELHKQGYFDRLPGEQGVEGGGS